MFNKVKYRNKQGVIGKSPRFETHSLADSRAFAFYDFTVKNNVFSWHYHPELELIYWPTARGIRMAGDSIEDFENGDFCLIGSNLPHAWSISATPAHPERNIQVQFPPDCLGSPLMALEEMRALRKLIEKSRQGLKIIGNGRRVLGGELLRIAAEKPRLAKRFCRILDILMELAESPDIQPLASSVAVPSVNPRIDQAVGKVLAFIQTNLDGDVPQTRAAALLGMSPAAFSRFFKRHVGNTYVGFINQLRIGRACMALQKTDRTIAEIAYDGGFENLSHFNKQFRRYKRLSPSQYRKRIQSVL
jgi:AraC-like DNA-binding protein